MFVVEMSSVTCSHPYNAGTHVGSAWLHVCQRKLKTVYYS